LYYLALVTLHLGQPEEACVIFETNDTLIRSFAAPKILAFALTYRGRALAAARNDYATAKALHVESLAVGRHWQDPEALGTTTMNLGFLALQEKDYEAAKTHYLESLAWRRQAGGRFNIALALWNVADVACIQGDFQQAQFLYVEALALCRAMGHQTGVANSLLRLGYLEVQQGDLAQAASNLAELGEINRERGIQPFMPFYLLGTAELWRAQGQLERAVCLLAFIRQPGAMWGRTRPAQQILYERSVAAARSQLDEVTFNAAWAQGLQLTLEQAVAYALN
jgi:tetratricopeptide (TPR) repeat protein